jgi:hypothetical protein
MFRIRAAGALIAAVVFCGLSIPAYSANHDAQEYAALQRLAGEKQYVRVIIDLNVDIPLGAPDKQPAALKGRLSAKEAAVFADLGKGALKTGSWKNGLGQMGAYVTEEGLKRLAVNSDVRAFGLDPTGGMRSGIYDDDGRVAKISAEIERNGFADVEITLNLENLDFDIGRNAAVVHKPTAAQRSEVQAIYPALRSSLPSRGTLNSLPSSPQSEGPAHTLRIDKEGLFALREHDNVRGLRLAGDAGATPFQIEPEVLDVARQFGYADVTIDLRRPSVYSPMKGKLPVKAWQAQVKAIREAFTDIFSSLSTDDVKLAQDFEGIASATFRLTTSALERITREPDPRLQRISLIKGVSTGGITYIANPTTIRDSMRYVGMHNAWNKGLTGAGQTIMILDNGFETTHPFISGKVTIESCFNSPNGTTQQYIDAQGITQTGMTYSLCPSANPATGDSPIGLPGSAGNCGPWYDLECYHGTHVAGIAAGKAGWNAALGWNSGRGLSGMAPGASIIAAQVFSELRTSSGAYVGRHAADDDLVAALTALLNVAPSTGAEVTVTMSLGTSTPIPYYQCPFKNPAFNDRVASLNSQRVPVVAITGNNGSSDAISWPGCVPKVIKVAASLADQNGVPGYTNTIHPAHVGEGRDPATGVDLIVFAPGGDNGTDSPPPGIVSANLGGNVGAAAGTSMAAPHVAGLYAAIKQAVPGVSVANASSWIWAQAAATPLYTSAGYSIGRITIPVLP